MVLMTCMQVLIRARYPSLRHVWWMAGCWIRLRASSCGATLVTRRAPMRSASALDLDAGDEALLWKEDRLWEEQEALLSGRWTLTSAISSAGEEARARSVTSKFYQASDSKGTS